LRGGMECVAMLGVSLALSANLSEIG